MTGAEVTIRYRDEHGTDHLIRAANAAAVAFEDAHPIRDIPAYRGQRHTPGRYWCATTADLLAYESRLEAQWMTLLDFDPDAVALSAQPMLIDAVDTTGAWKHVPDLFARLADGGVRLVDAKHPDQHHQPDVVLQARRTAQLCAAWGWDYQLVGAIDAQRWANIAWLAGFRRPLGAGQRVVAQLLNLTANPISIAQLLSFMKNPELARPALFHLCWHQQIRFDLDQPLREHTVVRAVRREDHP